MFTSSWPLSPIASCTIQLVSIESNILSTRALPRNPRTPLPRLFTSSPTTFYHLTMDLMLVCSCLVHIRQGHHCFVELASSRPSTPSLGSAHANRVWVWSDDEESSSDSEPDQKRAKRQSVSPVSSNAIYSRAHLFEVSTLGYSHFPAFLIILPRTPVYLELPIASSTSVPDPRLCL